MLAHGILSGLPNPGGGNEGMLRQHWMVESMKHAFAARTALGDPGTPQHSFRNMDALVKDMLDPDFATELRCDKTRDVIVPGCCSR